MSLQRPFGLRVALVLLIFLTACCATSTVYGKRRSSSDKQEVMYELARQHIRIGAEQYRRGLYVAAEQSLLEASQYKGYLNEAERGELEDLLAKVRDVTAERQNVLAEIDAAAKLVELKEFLRAKARLIQARDSRYLTTSDRQEIDFQLEAIDQKLQAEKTRIEQLYTQSVALYKQGKLREAGQGFREVAMSGLIDAAPGEMPQDYLEKIEAKIGQVGLEKTPAPVADTEPAPAAEAVLPGEQVAPDVEISGSYIDKVVQRRNIQRSYTRTVVNDAIAKANEFVSKGEFNKAIERIEVAASVVNRNKLVLGDELTKQFTDMLEQLKSVIAQNQLAAREAEEQRQRQEAAALQTRHRAQQEEDRRKQIEEYMNSSLAFVEQRRYRDALGSLEMLLNLDEHHSHALSLKQMVEDTLNYQRQIEVIRDTEKQELDLLVEAQRSSIPHANEITFPRDWPQIVEKRAPEELAGADPRDAAIYKQLAEVVDLSALRLDTEFAQAIETIRNAVSPPLTIFVRWRDLSENAYVEQTTQINFEGIAQVTLGKGLELLLDAVSGGLADIGYTVKDGIITIATREAIPSNMVTRVYPVTELLGAPANFSEGGDLATTGGGGGGRGGGGTRGGGAGRTGGRTGATEAFDIAQVEERATDIIELIEESIARNTWYSTGGEGTIKVFGTQLIITQTPEVHEQIRQLLNEMRKSVGQEVAIEARFLTVTENFLEQIGVDLDFRLRNLGGKWGIIDVEQDSMSFATATDTGVSGSLSDLVTDAATLTGGYGSILDDLQVSFLVKATQANASARTLTAPKVTVLSGEVATITIQNEIAYVSDWDLTQTISTESANVVTTADPTVDTIFDGVVLTVNPTISADKKYVLLLITTSFNRVLGIDERYVGSTGTGADLREFKLQLPLMQTADVSTRVNVPDGGTLLIGGQKLTGETETEEGVPGFSKLPLFGRLFQNRAKSKDSAILLILVKPTIILKEEKEREAFPMLRQ
ncbi:MAG: hypothetical protein ABIG61_10760 [Planctomycetota bacterium]